MPPRRQQNRQPSPPPPGINQPPPAMAKNTNYINLIGTFEGESAQECTFFFDQIDEIAKVSNISEQEKVMIVRAKLRGRALSFLINDPTLSSLKNYDQIKTAFTNYFSENNDLTSNQLKFNNIKQLEGESVKDLAHRIMIASHNYLGISEAIINEETKKNLDKLRLAKFVSALNNQLQTEVIKSNPTSFKQAITIAGNLQNALNTIAHIRINNLLEDNTTDTRAQQELHELRQQVNNLRLTNNIAQPQQRSCHLCGRSNHFTSDCYVYKNLYGRGNRQQTQQSNRGQHNQRQFRNEQQDRRPQDNHYTQTNRQQSNQRRGAFNSSYQNRRRQFNNTNEREDYFVPEGSDDRQYERDHTNRGQDEIIHQQDIPNEEHFLEAGAQNTNPA